MDFRDFKKQRTTSTDEREPQDDIRKTAERYAEKSDAELLSDIMRMAGENKRNGSLSNEELDEFERKVIPMLNREQRKRLENVLRMLKG